MTYSSFEKVDWNVTYAMIFNAQLPANNPLKYDLTKSATTITNDQTNLTGIIPTVTTAPLVAANNKIATGGQQLSFVSQ